MKISKIFLPILLIVFFTSCDSNKLTQLPGSTGATYEILVVSDIDYWDGSVGSTVKDFFYQPDTTLFMTEPLYKLTSINKKQFDENKLYKFYKNILILEIDNSLPTKVETIDTVWAKPQRVFKIQASDANAFDSIFNKYSDYILQKYIELEREKFQVYYSTAKNKSVMRKIGEKFGYTMIVPNAFYIAKNLDGFMWLRSETTESSINLLIYTEDYTSENQLNPAYIKLKRNLITEDNIPCSLDGSYAMIVDDFPISTKTVDFNGMYAIESRGAWECENDFMGGTFLNYTIVDEKNGRILTLDGFVYFPNKEKRALMLQLESIMWSLTMWDDDLNKKL
ncbi:MAG: DUF4837 family protein [Bacteroidales bacterium]|jgi:hypothetical protein